MMHYSVKLLTESLNAVKYELERNSEDIDSLKSRLCEAEARREIYNDRIKALEETLVILKGYE